MFGALKTIKYFSFLKQTNKQKTGYKIKVLKDGLKCCQEPRDILRVSSLHIVLILCSEYFQGMFKLVYAINKYWSIDIIEKSSKN